MTISVCIGSSCHVKRSADIIALLREAIKTNKPTYCIHGHLHTSNHNEEILYNTKIYNVSYINEDYRIAFKPLYFEINN